MLQQPKKLALFSLGLLSSLSLAVHAQPPTQHKIVTPTCMLQKIERGL